MAQASPTLVRDLCQYDWTWKQREVDKPLSEDIAEGGGSSGWRKTTTFPSEVHIELLQAGLIPDPYIGFNEHTVQWVGEVEWLYRCSFAVDNSTRNHKHALVRFEGLDTLCDVYLNGLKVLSTDNMFRTYEYPINLSSGTLKDQNTILLHFKSAKALAKAEEAKYGKVRAGSTNLGDPSRVYVRKAQYNCISKMYTAM